jgi:hypothetical protein
MTAESRKHGTILWVGLVTAAAAWFLVRAGWPDRDLPHLAAWFAACLVGEIFWLHTGPRDGIISMALALDLAAIFALGPGSGLVVIGLSTLIAGIYPHRRRWYRTLFNAAHSVVAAAAALLVWTMLSPASPGTGTLREIWLPLFPAGVAFCLTDTGLVSLVVALSTGRSPWRVWRENFGYRYELASCLAEISLAGLVLTSYQLTGIVTLAAIFPLLAVLWWGSSREANTRARGVSKAPEASEEADPPLRIAV